MATLKHLPLCFALTLTSGCGPIVEVPVVLKVEVVGSAFEWHTRYAGNDALFGTSDDRITKRDLVTVAGVDTDICLKSVDYVYSFALPHLQLKEIAVPDMEFHLNFTPPNVGEFTLKGDQLCGYRHPKLMGKVRVLSPEQYADWLSKPDQ